MSILETINSPADLKSLSIEELEKLAAEVRDQLIETVNRNGGHLASPLGVVELTVALHRVFDVGAGKDQIVWDVGHQCYAHKLLTGRRGVFHTIRQQDGISGYPKISESEFDCFGTGHSSTSISAGLGMAVARDLKQENFNVVALIGDGSMTAGMAWEALSHAGALQKDLIVILNDNEMSISPNVGALSHYFSRLITARGYKRAKQDVGSFVKTLLGQGVTQRIQELEKSVKGLITHGQIFQELGFNYVGPVDGHDLPMLIEVLANLKEMKGPILFHVRTEKGKGLVVAEQDPLKYHGIKPKMLDRKDQEGEPRPSEEEIKTPPTTTFTDAFADAMIELGRENPRVVGITAAMPTGTGLSRFETYFPDRMFDVGICEQHAVTLAAGLAIQGMRPVTAIYSTFLQRGYDQLIHDVAIQNLPVVFAIDRAGLVGEDSPTQNGTFDLSFLRCVPNLVVGAPRDDVDTRLMLRWAVEQQQPVALRYARGKSPTIAAAEERDIVHGELLRDGHDAVFLTVGPLAAVCLEAAEQLEAEGYSIGVADARWIKPVDGALIESLLDRPIISVEENTLDGGFGSAVLEHVNDIGRLQDLRLRRLGIPDRFSEQATRDEQLSAERLDLEGFMEAVREYLREFARETV